MKHPVKIYSNLHPVALSALACFLFMGSCKSRQFNNAAGVKEFVPLESPASGVPISFSLSRVEAWNKSAKPEDVLYPKPMSKKLTRPAVAPFPEKSLAFSTIEIGFGKLNLNQYNFLMKTYRGAGTVAYSAKREYFLTDFLPPLVQALNAHVFLYQSEKVERINEGRSPDWKSPDGTVSNDVTVSTNCWGTVYEISRFRSFDLQKASAPSEFYIFYTDRGQAEAVLKSDQYSTSLDSPQLVPNMAEALKLESGISAKEPGDVILITSDVALKNGRTVKVVEHAAIYLDEGLYFEKHNGGSDDPYRITTFAELVESYVKKRPTTLEYRRFNKETLPEPTSIFGDPAKVKPDDPRYAKPIPPELAARIKLSSEFYLEDGQRYYTWSGFFEVKLTKAADGRHILDPNSSFKKETFQFDPSAPRNIVW